MGEGRPHGWQKWILWQQLDGPFHTLEHRHNFLRDTFTLNPSIVYYAEKFGHILVRNVAFTSASLLLFNNNAWRFNNEREKYPSKCWHLSDSIPNKNLPIYVVINLKKKMSFEKFTKFAKFHIFHTLQSIDTVN